MSPDESEPQEPLTLGDRYDALLYARDSFKIAFLNLSTARKLGGDVPPWVLASLKRSAQTLDKHFASLGTEVVEVAGDMGHFKKGQGGIVSPLDVADVMMPLSYVGKGASWAARATAKYGPKAGRVLKGAARGALRGAGKLLRWGGKAGAALGVGATLAAAIRYSLWGYLGYRFIGPIGKKLKQLGFDLMPLLVGVGLFLYFSRGKERRVS